MLGLSERILLTFGETQKQKKDGIFICGMSSRIFLAFWNFFYHVRDATLCWQEFA